MTWCGANHYREQTGFDVASLLDVERSTANQAINCLREEGVVEEVTGKERYQEFRARGIFEILERLPRPIEGGHSLSPSAFDSDTVSKQSIFWTSGFVMRSLTQQ